MEKKLLQINITANWGSHGRIAEEIGQLAMSQGWESHIAYGRWANPSQSQLYHIGSMWDERWHGLQSRLFDNHGLASKKATRKLLEEIKRISPNIIHLHNIHGYYLNYPLLFDYLAKSDLPVVWTLHDCWPITGHCAGFTYAPCEKWKFGCKECQHKETYPQSLFLSKSERNYVRKRQSFNSLDKLVIVPVSQWLADIVNESHLRNHSIKMIHNGIDLDKFRPAISRTNHLNDMKIVLGVCSVWEPRKGLKDFYLLRDLLDNSYQIVLIGLTNKQIKVLPSN